MKTQFKPLLIFILSFAPLLTIAHPGHDGHEHEDGFSIIHYFTQPDHLVAILTLVIIGVGLIWYKRNHKQSSR